VASSGVVYVAFGRNYSYQAAFSAMSLRMFSDIPIRVLSNLPDDKTWRGIAGVEWVHCRGENKDNRDVKTDMFRHSPFDRTLYLDTDTAIRSRSFLQGFRMLDEWDVMGVSEDNPLRGPEDTRKLGVYALANARLGYRFPVELVNGGMLFFRKSGETKRFFATWHAAWAKLGRGRDMPALAWALQQCVPPLKFRLLPLTWNCPVPSSRAVIAHAWGKHRLPGIPSITKLKPNMHDNATWHKRAGVIDLEKA